MTTSAPDALNDADVARVSAVQEAGSALDKSGSADERGMGGAHGGSQLHDNGRLAVRANLQKLKDPEGPPSIVRL
ncbi:hypothetical protein ACLQ2E_25210 [Streptomyces lavendulocolor]